MTARLRAGRKPKYDPKYHPQLAKFMARSGLTDEEMAQELGIGRATLSRWKNEYPEFAEALQTNKSFVDSLVEDSLLKRAMGYETEETQVTAVPKSEAGASTQQLKPNSRVKRLKKHIPPDVTACIFWLKNRQPKRWRDKIDHEHSGPGGAPIPVEATVDLKALSDEELKMLEDLLAKAADSGGDPS